MPHLRVLSAELIIRIMTQLETPHDLYNLINTSHHFSQIFQANRVTILVDVIKNAFAHDNIYTAVAACKADRISKLWWADSSADIIARTRERFFQENPHGRAPKDCSLRDPSLLNSLYKLWQISDYFVTRFQQTAFDSASKTLPHAGTLALQEMNNYEKSRIQRAFLRSEVLRRTSPTIMRHSGSANQNYEQTERFLQHFPPWEREEVLSVQEFLVDYVKGIFRDTEGYFIREVFDMARDLTATYDALNRPYEKEQVERLEMFLDLSGLNLFENRGNTRRFQYFVARGLPCIKWLDRLPYKQRYKIVIRHSVDEDFPSVFEVLSSEYESFRSFDTQAGWSQCNHPERLQRPNDGWKWVLSNKLTVDKQSLLRRHALRKMGYVFWDTARLRDDWSLETIRPSMLDLPLRERDDDNLEYLKEPRFRDRFKDILLPKDALDGHAEEGGTVRRFLGPGKEWDEKVGYPFPEPFSDKENKVFNIEY